VIGTGYLFEGEGDGGRGAVKRYTYRAHIGLKHYEIWSQGTAVARSAYAYSAMLTGNAAEAGNANISASSNADRDWGDDNAFIKRLTASSVIGAQRCLDARAANARKKETAAADAAAAAADAKAVKMQTKKMKLLAATVVTRLTRASASEADGPMVAPWNHSPMGYQRVKEVSRSL
jgi:hypothetical protein